jgi:O-antigen/teichoic acid export membrane protein
MKARKVVSAVLYNYASTIFVTVTGFIFTAFIVHHVTHARFGVWVLTGSLIGYSALFDLGIGLTVMKMVAERAYRGDRDEIDELISNALFMYMLIGLAVMCIAFGLEPFLADIFRVHGETLFLFRVSLAIAGVGVGITFPSGILTATCQAVQDFRYVNMLIIAMQVVSVSCEVVALLLGFGIIGVVVVGTVVNIAGFAAKLIHARRAFGIRPQLRLRRWPVARQIFAMSLWVFVLNVAAQAIFETDNVVVGAVLGAAAVASYQVALGPASGLQTLGSQFNSVSLTAASSLRSLEARAELGRLLTEATRMIGIVVMPVVVIFVLWGRQLLSLWVGHDFVTSYPTLVVLSIGMMMAALQGTASQVILALNRYRVTALVALGEAICNLTLSVLLARSMGIVGVAIGTTVPISCTTLGVYVPFACRLVGVSPWRLARRLALPAGINVVVFGVLRFIAASPRLFPDLIALLAVAGVVFACSVAASILLDGGERRTYLAMLRRQNNERDLTGQGAVR